MTEEDFEKLVEEALDLLPENIRRRMDNVEVVVERGSPRGRYLGLYQGIPKTAYGRGFGMNLPDKITIFQLPIENVAGTPLAVRELIRDTVWHEVAHHFGLDEGSVRELEIKRRRR